MNEEKIQEIVRTMVLQIVSETFNVPNSNDEKLLKTCIQSTPARIGVWRAGDRPTTEAVIRFRADHAAAMDSVYSSVKESLLDGLNLLKLQSRAVDRDQYITRPDYGRELCDASMKQLKATCKNMPQLQIIISDGLSSKAIEKNIEDTLPAFMQGLAVNGISCGTTVFVKNGRVGVMDAIGEELEAEAAIIFIGERPGLATAESMSAYLVFNPRRGIEESRRTVVSNIHKGGTPPIEAGAHLATLVRRILDAKTSGVDLDNINFGETL